MSIETIGKITLHKQQKDKRSTDKIRTKTGTDSNKILTNAKL